MINTNKLTNLLSKKSSSPLLMTHLVAGFPSLALSEKIALNMVDGGASIIEIQIPFSDPIADGPSIIGACQAALKKVVTIDDVLKLAKKINSIKKDTPIVLMSYANPIIQYGMINFVQEASKAGVSGIIIPELPVDSKEGKIFISASKKFNICPIVVVSPGVPEERLVKILKHAGGFIYSTSRQGITGANSSFAGNLPSFLASIRKISSIPIAVGFGVTKREDVSMLAPYAEIIVAGSVFISKTKSTPTKDIPGVVKKVVKELIG